MAAPNYDVNYEDERFAKVEAEKQQALTELEQTYGKQNADGTYSGGLIGSADKYYQDQIEATEEWAEKQSQLQQEQTDFTIKQIEQQKEQAQKDYAKEQTASYVDWRKQSNQYGPEAEKMAASGLLNTGFSESSQVSMYNAYQNRVAVAREAFIQAKTDYDNGITEARLQNNAALAEIQLQSLQQRLELALQGFQYKNSLITEQATRKLELETIYHSRWQDVLSQINQENAMAEEVRQYNESLALQKAQLAEDQRQFNETMAYNKSNSGGNGNSGVVSGVVSDGIAKIDKPTGVGSWVKNAVNAVQAATQKVSTPYYQGSLNADATTYGTFSNGYQPKGISGHGKLSKSGQTIEVSTVVQYGDNKGKKKTLVQTVWKAEDGTLWYWEGRENKYKPVKE